MRILMLLVGFFLKEKTADEMRISDWSSDVCSSDLRVLIAALFEHSRIDTREGEGAHERSVHDLELQRRERRGIRRRALVRRLAVELDALDRRHVERARQIIDDRVEQRLNTLVLERRPAQHGDEREVERTLADQLAQRIGVGLGAFEIRFHDVVVLLDRHLDQLGARRRDGVLHVVRSEEHTSELQSLMRISYAVFCFKKQKKIQSQIIIATFSNTNSYFQLFIVIRTHRLNINLSS